MGGVQSHGRWEPIAALRQLHATLQHLFGLTNDMTITTTATSSSNRSV